MSGNDKEIIQKLLNWLLINFPLLRFEIKVPLKKLFPKPENKWLQSFWNSNSHADISTFRHGKLIAIIEPGGWHYHLKDKKQMLNDRKKYIICKLNRVNVLRIVNDVVENDLEMLKTKRLFKKYFYGKF